METQIVPIIIKNGFFYAICDKRSWTSRLETYYIVNYLFKYWELADTLFLVVKKKPLGGFSSLSPLLLHFTLNAALLDASLCLECAEADFDLYSVLPLPTPNYFSHLRHCVSTAFLHVYHHSATAVLCYTQLHGTFTFITLSISCLVHESTTNMLHASLNRRHLNFVDGNHLKPPSSRNHVLLLLGNSCWL